jgi:hypothetical protein
LPVLPTCVPQEEEEEVYDVESIVGMKGSGRSLMLEIKCGGRRCQAASLPALSCCAALRCAAHVATPKL